MMINGRKRSIEGVSFRIHDCELPLDESDTRYDFLLLSCDYLKYLVSKDKGLSIVLNKDINGYYLTFKSEDL